MPGFLVVLGLAVLPAVNIEALVACTSIRGDADRLKCYDVQLGLHPAPLPASPESPGAAAATVTVHAEAPPTTPAVATPTTPEAGFGLTAEQREARASRTEKGDETDRIKAVVHSTKMTATGRLLLTLDNGQEWLQVEPSSRQRFFEGESITIRKASLGSYLASGPSSGTGVRIKRID